MSQNSRLTQGSIPKALITLALPIMATSFIQMAYNMTDMIWIGRLGTDAMAAVGAAGFFMWLAFAFILIPKLGAEIGVAQSVGKGDNDSVKSYIRHTITLIVVFALFYGTILVLFRNQLIGFFKIDEPEVVSMAVSYLTIIGFGIIFAFVNPVLTGILNGYGNSKIPFFINAIGLVANMILDPLLIFGYGPFPALGVRGAAIATVIAQATVTMIFINTIKTKIPVFSQINFFKALDKERIRGIVKLGLPAAIQSGLFTFIAMIVTRIVGSWGSTAIAVQKVGSQIESISWMTAGGFSTALGAFVGQNYGAKKWDRIYKGYLIAMVMVGAIGIFATGLLVFASRPVFTVFIPKDEEAIKIGIVYLKILGLSQLFMCIEIATAGAFNGLGKTIPPSIVSIIFNALRIPTALILSSEGMLGLNGVWWSISISSILKGLVLVTWFIIVLNSKPFEVGKKISAFLKNRNYKNINESV